MAPGLNYGQQCYEGLKAFRGPDDKTINIFRPRKNAARLQHSASFISIPLVPIDHFLHCVRIAVAMNAEYVPPHATGAAMYIRPLLFGSSAQLGLNPPQEYTFCVYVLPTGVYHGTHPVDAVILEEFDRTAPHGTGSAKVGGNYAPVLRWSEKARDEGYGITLHLDSKTRTEIDEFSTSGFIGVHKKEDGTATLVVPNSANIVDSVTSDSVCQIAQSFGWKVEKRRVRIFFLTPAKKNFRRCNANRRRSPSLKSQPLLKYWPLVLQLPSSPSAASPRNRLMRSLSIPSPTTNPALCARSCSNTSKVSNRELSKMNLGGWIPCIRRRAIISRF